MAASEPPGLDRVLRALADPTRRRILRSLAERPGMSTNELADRIAPMTRWGVMKHLALLGDAGLVHTMSDGRRRRHFRDAAALAPVRTWLDDASG